MKQLEFIKIYSTSIDDEKVVIKVIEDCNLNSYILFNTTFDEKGIVTNKLRHIFIFPNINVKKGDFVWVFTKKGLIGNHQNTSNTTTYKLYWNLNDCLWSNAGDKVYILHYDDWSLFER